MRKHLYWLSAGGKWKHSMVCWCKTDGDDDIRDAMGYKGDRYKYRWFVTDGETIYQPEKTYAIEFAHIKVMAQSKQEAEDRAVELIDHERTLVFVEEME